MNPHEVTREHQELFLSGYVDELLHNDPHHSLESFEEADFGSTEETHAEQPTTQTRSQCSPSEDHIPIQKKRVD